MSPRKEIISSEGISEETHALEASPAEERFEEGIRPRHLHEFVGQEIVRAHLEIVLDAARARGQAVDHLLEGLGRIVREKETGLFDRRGQAGQVIGNASGQGAAIRLRRRLETRLFQTA
jgi:hypothetical protein